jgi:hypothetical protein
MRPTSLNWEMWQRQTQKPMLHSLLLNFSLIHSYVYLAFKNLESFLPNSKHCGFPRFFLFPTPQDTLWYDRCSFNGRAKVLLRKQLRWVLWESWKWDRLSNNRKHMVDMGNNTFRVYFTSLKTTCSLKYLRWCWWVDNSESSARSKINQPTDLHLWWHLLNIAFAELDRHGSLPCPRPRTKPRLQHQKSGSTNQDLCTDN